MSSRSAVTGDSPKRVRKYDRDGAATMRFYNEVDPRHCPSVCVRVGKYVSYEFVVGDMPRDLVAVLQAAENAMWFGETTPISPSGRVFYSDYATKKATFVGIPHDACRAIFDELIDAELTPVRVCHGDMTAENVIVEASTGIVKFIDPGNARGLPCREIDEAKLMQSMDGWERAKGLDPKWDLNACLQYFQPKRVHWILLASHYARLLMHQHSAACLIHASNRLRYIIGALNDGREPIFS